MPVGLFREIGYEDAVKLSQTENKPLFLLFDGDWAHDREKLIVNTLANPSISPLLRDRTVALRIEVVDLPDIAKKHHVSKVPLLVLLAPGGREINRWSGVPKPRAFAKEFDALLAGASASQYKRTLTKDTDLVARHQLAGRLVVDGEYAEALQELLWLYNTGIGENKLIEKDLHVSSVIRSLGRLKAKFPPAADALVALCDREKQHALRSPNNTTTGRKLAEILRALADNDISRVLDGKVLPDKIAGAIVENDSSLAVYRELHPGKARELVKNMVIIPWFVSRHDYKSAADELPLNQALSAIEEIKEMNMFGRGMVRSILFPVAGTKVPGLMIADQQRHILQKRAIYFEIYAGANRIEEAREVARAILKSDRLKQAPAVLRESAQKVCGDRTITFLQALALPELPPTVTPQSQPAQP
ncbi:MAG: hypothetical protein QM715_04255 [Nibricoccus sp.]